LKLRHLELPLYAEAASLPGNGGRGLKQGNNLIVEIGMRLRSPATGGVD